jgi:hypothetical protein
LLFAGHCRLREASNDSRYETKFRYAGFGLDDSCALVQVAFFSSARGAPPRHHYRHGKPCPRRPAQGSQQRLPQADLDDRGADRILHVVHGIAGAGDLKKVGRVGFKSLAHFEVMTTIALTLGFLLALLFEPAMA